MADTHLAARTINTANRYLPKTRAADGEGTQIHAWLLLEPLLPKPHLQGCSCRAGTIKLHLLYLQAKDMRSNSEFQDDDLWSQRKGSAGEGLCCQA